MAPIDNSPIPIFHLQRYLGKWYEIARYDHFFERDLERVTATYTLRADGKIRVLNCGYRPYHAGFQKKCSIGKARFAKNGHGGHLEVSFFLSFYSDYLILELDSDYEWALIGSSSDKYLWILSRTPQLSPSILQQILEKASRRGYDTSKLIFTRQSKR